MDEYTASRTQVQTIIKATQTIKTSLTCIICLDYFEKPVTLKCGHKFCHSCISEVANKDNANCPLCNAKIGKRSIPEESNEHVESCIKHFKILLKSIADDSGIDVLEIYSTVQHSKESVPSKSKPSDSRVEEASTSSKGSINSKILVSNKGTSRKKSFIPKTQRTKSIKKNTLHRYLSSNSNYNPNENIESQDKVESWLKDVNPDEIDNKVIDETSSVTVSHPEDSSLNKKMYLDEPSTSKTNFTALKEDCQKPLPNTYPSTSKMVTKYKEIEMSMQEAVIIAKKRKSNQGLVDKAILKTPSCVPAASHSDAQDWRRVKRVGKEMQVKTFKSLNVSKEKSSSSITLDDTVPYNSTNNDSKNVSKESNINANSFSDISVTTKTKRKKSWDKNQSDSKQQNYQNELQNQSYNQRSLNSTDSHKDDNTLSYLDSKQVNEIIGIQSLHDLKTPERISNACNISSSEIRPKLVSSSPLKINNNPQLEANQLSDEESSNLDSKSTIINPLNSPSKHRLSLNRKLSDSSSSKSIPSHASSTPNKTYKENSESQKIIVSERPKSRLSLRLPSSKTPDNKLNHIKSPEKNKKCSVKNKQAQLPNERKVIFKKLGKIGKKQKHISFIKLGRLYPRIVNKCIPVITSDERVNVNLSVKSKPQFKKLITNTLPSTEQVGSKKHHKMHQPAVNQTDHTIVPMDIVESLDKNVITHQGKQVKSNEIFIDKSKIHVETTTFEPMPSTSNFEETDENSRTNEREHTLECQSSKTGQKQTKHIRETNIHNYNKLKNTDISKLKSITSTKEVATDKDVNVLRTKNLRNNREIEGNVISLSSNDSESKNLEKFTINKQTISEAGSTTSESSLIYVPNDQEILNEKNSICSSRSSSPLKTSPLKKKRTHSESSNDYDDISSIIGKWTTEKPVVKKQKLKKLQKSKSKFNPLKNFDTDDDDNDEKTLVKDEFKEPHVAKPQRDSPIDDIITKVKSFKNKKESNCSGNKLTNLPSSLQSADLFESNDQNIRVNFEPVKQSNDITSDNSSANTWSPNKDSDKENMNQNQSLKVEEPELENTMVDLLQFDQKNQSKSSNCSNTSNKENKEFKKLNESTPNKTHVAERSNDESYNVPDTLMNITQEQIAFKMIEKDLIGDNISTTNNANKNSDKSNKLSTPQKKIANPSLGNDDDFDSESINATPMIKKRRIISKSEGKSTVGDGIMVPDAPSPQDNFHLIPAVTPVRNTKSYPLCHSTPMINTPNLKEESKLQNKSMTLICSGLTPGNVEMVQKFAKKFNATFLSAFQDNVTHVIVATDPETKIGQKTFKYIQGIAYKKHVISFQWVLDCLNANAILDENDETYDVLDLDCLECGSRRSRNRLQGVFQPFAIYSCEPFTSVPMESLKNLLAYNGATVVSSMNELNLRKDKYRIAVVESDEINSTTLAALKKVDCAIVCFDWVVDCISQYQVISLSPYLLETSPEKAIAIGFPASFLIEDDEEVDEE